MGYLERLRAAIGPERVVLISTTAIVRDAEGRILLQRRTDFEADAWSLPGGMLELGETLSDCVRREVREETGYETRTVRLLALQSSPRWDVNYPNGDQVQQWSAVFECRPTRQVGGADPAETRGQQWFAPGALPALCRPWYTAAHAALTTSGPAAFDPLRPEHVPTNGGYILDLRRRFGPDPLISPGSAAVVENARGEILLIRRADNGEWALPAGYLDLGESAAETAVREAYEETGVVCQPTHLVGVYTGADHQVTYANGDQTQFASAVFACRHLDGEPRPDGVETLEARWFPPDPRALPGPMRPRIRRRIAEALNRRAEAYFQ